MKYFLFVGGVELLNIHFVFKKCFYFINKGKIGVEGVKEFCRVKLGIFAEIHIGNQK